MQGHIHNIAFHRVPYFYVENNFLGQKGVVRDFLGLIDTIESNNLTTKSLKRLLELWKGNIPRGRVPKNAREIFYQLKMFLSDCELDEDIVYDYLSARIIYYRDFTLQNKDQQIEYLHFVIEQEGRLLCFANGLSSLQVDFFRQDAKANYLTASLFAIGSQPSSICSIVPLTDLKRLGLNQINYQEYKKHPGAFREFIEHFVEEINCYRLLSKKFSKNLPLKYKLAKAINNSADNKVLKKVVAEPDWLFFNHPSRLRAYKLKNSVARRLYA